MNHGHDGNNLPLHLQAQLQEAAQKVRRPAQTGSLPGPQDKPLANRYRQGPTPMSINPPTPPSLAQITAPDDPLGNQPWSSYPNHPPLTHGQVFEASLSSTSQQQASRNQFQPQQIDSPQSSSSSFSHSTDGLIYPWGHLSLPSDPSQQHSHFPPLGASSTASSEVAISSGNQLSLPTSPPLQYPYSSSASSVNHTSGQAGYHNNMSAETAQAFLQRAAGGAYRHGSRSNVTSQRNFRPHPPDDMMSPTVAMDAPDGTFRRQVPQNARLFDPKQPSNVRFGDQQASLEAKAVVQSEFLQGIALRELQKQVSIEELMAKDNFRKKLERLVHSTLTEYAKDHLMPFEPEQVRLKTYGSLASGFAVAGSDLDLLLVFPKDRGPLGSIELESRRMLEKVFLDEGYGARLLTQTRVPIMRVCERPNSDLLKALKQKREEWEKEESGGERNNASTVTDDMRLPSEPSEETSSAAETFFAKLDIDPAGVDLPPSPVPGHAHLEFKGDVGIQCDINFSNYVAIYNTALLRCYCKCDSRVRELVLIVKAWAKTRKINDPYHGTLSSYGYVLMVLHYLMNIAQPPVVPNLQRLAQKERAKKVPPPPPKMCEGNDVTFFDNEGEILRRAQTGRVTGNREMLGSLLRGFFRYYADNKGFHWTKNVISIRTDGGIITKEEKGWTIARWDGVEKAIRQRYLLAIEDPFEIHHNIARTVGHSGIVAIRDEFRRALDILYNVQSIPGAGWQWRKRDGTVGEDFFQRAEDRGDLHRKDQDRHAERMRATKASAKLVNTETGSGPKIQESEKSTAAQNQRAEPADGKGTKPKERVELTKHKKSQSQYWKNRHEQKKQVIKDSDKSRSEDKPSSPSVEKKQPEVTGSSTYQRIPDHEIPPSALPKWGNSGFDPARYGRPTSIQTPPQTPSHAKPKAPATIPPPKRADPSPPSSPSLSKSTNVEAKDKYAWMFIPAPTLLDPQQLRDIQTIQQGRNGCVRLAEDFESSWGGGGRMGTDGDVHHRANSRRRGKEVVINGGGSDDVGSQWSEVVDGMVRNRGRGWERGRKAEQMTRKGGREIDSSELVGELPFCGPNGA